MATPAQSIQPVHTLGGEQNGRVERAGGAGGWSGRVERSGAERSGAERSGAERSGRHILGLCHLESAPSQPTQLL